MKIYQGSKKLVTKNNSCFDFPVHSIFTFDVFWVSLSPIIIGNSSSAANNTRTRLPSRLFFRFLWLWYPLLYLMNYSNVGLSTNESSYYSHQWHHELRNQWLKLIMFVNMPSVICTRSPINPSSKLMCSPRVSSLRIDIFQNPASCSECQTDLYPEDDLIHNSCSRWRIIKITRV